MGEHLQSMAMSALIVVLNSMLVQNPSVNYAIVVIKKTSENAKLRQWKTSGIACGKEIFENVKRFLATKSEL